MSDISELRKEVRGDIRDVRKDVQNVGKEVSKISGILEAKLPFFATDEGVDLKLAEHRANDHKSQDKPKRPSIPDSKNFIYYKKAAQITGAIFALSGAVYALAQVLGY